MLVAIYFCRQNAGSSVLSAKVNCKRKGREMKSSLRILLVALFSAFMLTACVLSPGPGGYGVQVAPALPAVVELGAEPYYYHGGYNYYYQNDRWLYSKTRSGPWTELPRSHWPKEIRHSGRDNRGGGHNRDDNRGGGSNRDDDRGGGSRGDRDGR